MKKSTKLIWTLFLSLGLFFMACDKRQEDKSKVKVDVSGQIPAVADTSKLAKESTLPGLSLEEGKTAIEARLESLVTLLEEQQRSLMAREEELYQRERALIAKAAMLHDREQRLARLQVASWIVLALGVVAIIVGVIISRRTPGQASSTTGLATGEKAKNLKSEFVKNMETDLANVESKIGEMKKSAESVKEGAKKEYQKQIRSLQGKRSAFKKKLKALREAKGEAWEELKAGVQKAAEDLKQATDNAAAKLK